MTDDWPTNSTNCDCRWGVGRINLPNAADDRSCGDSALARRAFESDNPEDAIYDDWKQVELLKTNHVAFRPIDLKMGRAVEFVKTIA